MSTGEVLRVRAAMKPISTIPRALDTVDVATGEPAKAINQRSDVCAVPAAGVVAEAMVALVLADAVLEKFGGDSVRRDRPATIAAISTTSWSGEPPGRPGGTAGRGQDVGGPAAGLALGTSGSGTPTPTSKRSPDHRCRTCSSTAGEAAFRDLEQGGGRERAHRARRGAGTRRRVDPRSRTPACPAGPAPRGLPRRRGRPGRPARGIRARPPAAARQSARPVDAADGGPAGFYEEVATFTRLDRRGESRGRGRRRIVSRRCADQRPGA